MAAGIEPSVLVLKKGKKSANILGKVPYCLLEEHKAVYDYADIERSCGQ